MGSVDNKMMEEALVDLREQNEALRTQNKDIKDFIKHISVELSSFLNYNSIAKEL
jgi:hypothetical protein